jgi:hypothetical protein
MDPDALYEIHIDKNVTTIAIELPLRTKAAFSGIWANQPGRGLPPWDAAAPFEQVGNHPRWELAAQPVPAVEFDQRIAC